jgi:hypothetical protein
MRSAWGTHVDGALALLKLRATHVDSPFSRSMYFFVQKNVVRYSIPILALEALYLLRQVMSQMQGPEDKS